MKKHIVRISIIAAVALLMGGMTACSFAGNAMAGNSKTPQATTIPEIPSNTAPNASRETNQAKEYEKLERSRKRAEVQKKIETFLTQDQVKQLDSKLQQGEKMRQALSEMNLTTEQNAKIQAVFKEAKREHNYQDGAKKDGAKK